MPTVTVTFNEAKKKVEFHPKGGEVVMTSRGKIKFQKPNPQDPFVFDSFTLNPEDLAQFPRTVQADEILVDDLFTDKQQKAYKYTVVLKLNDGSKQVGDPQIVNKPGAMAAVRR